MYTLLAPSPTKVSRSADPKSGHKTWKVTDLNYFIIQGVKVIQVIQGWYILRLGIQEKVKKQTLGNWTVVGIGGRPVRQRSIEDP